MYTNNNLGTFTVYLVTIYTKYKVINYSYKSI